jgi:hypothetical protein
MKKKGPNAIAKEEIKRELKREMAAFKGSNH